MTEPQKIEIDPRPERMAAGYVMAGGMSSRFGQDKALVKLNGREMLARTLAVVAASGVRQTVVVGARSKYKGFGARCVEDKWPGEGPLGGILTALIHSVADKYGFRWILIVSCDMPFLNAEWLSFLVATARTSAAQVILARSEQGLEPLCACWRTDAGRTLLPAFKRGVRKVTEGIGLLHAEVLDEQDWKRFDSAGRLFWNMNTAADYVEARRIVESEQS
ncbi:MAG: molybdenum cofactor guanylyltransferase [Candidatus Acidiferrum sp.]